MPTAILSVHDKTGIIDFAKELAPLVGSYLLQAAQQNY